VLEQQLADREHLLGSFSLADVAFAPSLSILQRSGFDLSPWSHVSGWGTKVLARPAWHAANAA
jgi:glutathione S-transferase